MPSRRLGRLCVSLVTGAASGPDARIAAVSPTFGRLHEGTDRRSPGQTTLRRPASGRQSFTDATPATGPPSNLRKDLPNVAERLARARKTVSFAVLFQTETARDNEARMADRPPSRPSSGGYGERQSRVPSAVSCGLMVAVLSTLVDNHVDSSSSRLLAALLRHIRGTRR